MCKCAFVQVRACKSSCVCVYVCVRVCVCSHQGSGDAQDGQQGPGRGEGGVFTDSRLFPHLYIRSGDVIRQRVRNHRLLLLTLTDVTPDRQTEEHQVIQLRNTPGPITNRAALTITSDVVAEIECFIIDICIINTDIIRCITRFQCYCTFKYKLQGHRK